MLGIEAFLLALLWCSLILYLLKLKWSNSSYPPGPLRLPVIGNVWRMKMKLSEETLIKILTIIWQDKMAMMELKMKENVIRIRGLKEGCEEKVLRAFLVGKIAELLNEDVEVVEAMVVSAYRINSAYARKNKVPRDCIVQLFSKSYEELIFKSHYDSPIIVEGRPLQLMKEIPVRILRKRKDFAFWVEKLRRKGIPFRWEFPQGVSFIFKAKRHLILDTLKAKEFLRRYSKDFPDEDEVQTRAEPTQRETQQEGARASSASLQHQELEGEAGTSL